MTRSSSGISIIAITLLLMLGAGCATTHPVRSHRAGLFDKVLGGKRSERPRPQRTPSGEYVVPAEIKKMAQSYQWPVDEVYVTSSFGPRGSEFHEGVDLRAADGTPIRAAERGIVIYAGSKISGYGRMVVIRHPGGLSTVYAHNSRLLVHRGQRVRRGQVVAKSGHSGRVQGPHLHFEVRSGVTALDPTAFLRGRTAKPEILRASAKSKRSRSIASHR